MNEETYTKKELAPKLGIHLRTFVRREKELGFFELRVRGIKKIPILYLRKESDKRIKELVN